MAPKDEAEGWLGPVVGGKRVIALPPREAYGRAGMGDINDAFEQRYAQFKGQMPAAPNDRVYGAPFVPCVPPGQEWILTFVEAMKCQFEAMLRSVLESTPTKSVPPPYIAPPFTGIPFVVYQPLTVVAAAAPAYNEMIGIDIPSKTTFMLTAIGIEAESEPALAGLLFRIRAGGRVIPLFSDSSVPAGQFQGTFHFPLGSIAQPANLREMGTGLRIMGNSRFSLDVASNDAVNNHTAKAVIYSYAYPNPMAGQEEDGQMSTVCGGSGAAGG